MKTVTREQIAFDLRLGGIQRGDVVFMHSSLSAIGHAEGGANAVIDAVLDVIGSEGTFAVSTMSFKNPFDAENDPSTVGIISETHRHRADSIRSLRPVHCVNAIGARAKELTENHELCETNCGIGSPYLKLRDMRAKIIMLGVDLNRNTTMHAIEDIMDAVYLVDRTIPAPKYMPDYQNKTMVMRKFCPGHRNFIGFTPILRRAEALIEICVGDANVKIIDVAKMFAIGEELLRKDPLAFLCTNENCDHCAPVRRAWAQKEG